MAPQEQLSMVSNMIDSGNSKEAHDTTEAAEDPQLAIIELTMSFIPTLMMKAALLLGVPEILARHPGPLSPEEILLEIPGCKDNRDPQAAKNLCSILSMLVQKKIFSETVDESGESYSIRYGLTPLSKAFVNQSGSSTVQHICTNFTEKNLKAWNHLHETVLDSSAQPYVVANGHSIWEMMSIDPEFAASFRKSMEASVRIEYRKILEHYDFEGIETLVDVGGSLGGLIGSIVQAKPHIRGINFDVPHVIASAPIIPGVEHVSGDFFVSVPTGDAIIMKSILHDWNDEKSIQILQSCRKALPKSGKVIICDQVLVPASHGTVKATVGHMMNLSMLTLCNGKERYAEEWANLLEAAGFPRHRIIKVPTSYIDIIEAFVS